MTTDEISAEEQQQPIELVDAEFHLGGLNTPADEQAVSSLLNGMEGVRSLTISEGKVFAEYDPLSVTKAEMSEALEKAGYQIMEVECGRASPISNEVLEEPGE